MQREKLCTYCNKYFFYEDHSEERPNDITNGTCPVCVDIRAIPGETYERQTIINRFKMYLKENGVQVELFDEDSLLSMLKDFPKANNLYLSNGTYRTISLFTGTIFDGMYGKFVVGPVEIKVSNSEDNPNYVHLRQIICSRCKSETTQDKMIVLDFVLGFVEKRCQKCDCAKYVSKHERNTEGLNRNGSHKSDKSERAIAQSLNISLNDLRRHQISKREEPLEDGTIVNGLEIIRAYWDDSTYSPRYELRCPKCMNIYTCLQKRVELLSHPYCEGRKND